MKYATATTRRKARLSRMLAAEQAKPASPPIYFWDVSFRMYDGTTRTQGIIAGSKKEAEVIIWTRIDAAKQGRKFAYEKLRFVEDFKIEGINEARSVELFGPKSAIAAA